MAPSSDASDPGHLKTLVWLGLIFSGLQVCGQLAYRLRIFSIQEFGPVIHEFDPYFNLRATQYLYENGWQKFVTWFDYKVWYPLGRPVGTTIYPGMQVTAVFIKNFIMRDRMSLYDICCYMPAWFGVSASAFTGLMAYECSLPQSSSGSIITFIVDIYNGKKREVDVSGSSRVPAAITGVVTMAIMAIVPAHMMRSVGGGYDNESIAVTAMTMTFWLWCRSLRIGDEKSYIFGALAGLAYFYMVAAWGGYVFVLNLIGCHAVLLVLLGRFSTKIYRAYSLFYVIGTALAIQVPVVGLTPLKSLEQLAPCAVFLAYQVLQFCEIVRKRKKLSRTKAWLLRVQVSIFAAAVVFALMYILLPKGYFGPLSARVRGLFVKHTKTGNPLVDSVAEHQPANSNAYFQYLNQVMYLAPVGYAIVLFKLGDSASFLLVYGTVSYYFSNKMVRLVLLLGPIASALGGIVLGKVLFMCITSLIPWLSCDEAKEDNASESKKDGKKKKKKKADGAVSNDSASEPFSDLLSAAKNMLQTKEAKVLGQLVSVLVLVFMYFASTYFYTYCLTMAKGLSNPTIILKGKLQSGKEVIVDDYREAYNWLNENTPEDARILAWWDYGYQITGIANRTTLADGNTWNHEHIALLGKILTSSEEEGYEIARHLADYVLVWAGGGGDDIAKSPHLARIANSVYRDMCPGDPTCRAFGVRDREGNPSAMMSRSFLFKLVSNKVKPGVVADPAKFQEVFRTKYGKVRIYKILAVSKKSKDWVAKNRRCDVPGSWYCPGQYPPALKSVLDSKKDFAQLEDFNTDKSDSEYQKAYFEGLEKKKASKQASSSGNLQKTEGLTSEELDKILSKLRSTITPAQIEAENSRWENTEETTQLWGLINEKATTQILQLLTTDPIIAFMRSQDGRGPMWWAYEKRYMEVAVILTKIGVQNTLKDKYGKTPIDLLTGGK